MKGITVIDVMGAGKQRSRTQYYRGQEHAVNLLDSRNSSAKTRALIAGSTTSRKVRFFTSSHFSECCIGRV